MMFRQTNHRRDHRGLIAFASTATLLCMAPLALALDGSLAKPELDKAATTQKSSEAAAAQATSAASFFQSKKRLSMQEKVDLYNAQPGVDPIVCRRERAPGSNFKKMRCIAESTRARQAEMARRTIRIARQGQR